MPNNHTSESNPVLSQLLVRFDHVLEETAEEFGTQHWHSLLWNLHNVRPEDWDAQPTPGSRAIREIVMHIGTVFLAYENHIFGDGTRAWDDPRIDGVAPASDPESMVAWLRNAHGIMRSSFAARSDGQLNEITSWGPPWTYGSRPRRSGRRLMPRAGASVETPAPVSPH